MAREAIIIRPIVTEVPGDLEHLRRIEAELTSRITTYGTASKQFAPVVAVLTIINDSEAWKLHVNADGSQEHKSFKAYVQSFGWDASVPRLYQLMKEFRQGLIDARDDDPDAPLMDGINYDYVARTRSTGTSMERFATTQSKALGRFVDNFETAAHNIFESDPDRATAIKMVATLKAAIEPVKADLAAWVDEFAEVRSQEKADRKAAKAAERAEQKALAAGDDDDDSDSDDDDDDDDSLAN